MPMGRFINRRRGNAAAGHGAGRGQDGLISAQEIACYVYCREAWRIQYGLGLKPSNRAALDAGAKWSQVGQASNRWPPPSVETDFRFVGPVRDGSRSQSIGRGGGTAGKSGLSHQNPGSRVLRPRDQRRVSPTGFGNAADMTCGLRASFR